MVGEIFGLTPRVQAWEDQGFCVGVELEIRADGRAVGAGIGVHPGVERLFGIATGDQQRTQEYKVDETSHPPSIDAIQSPPRFFRRRKIQD